MIQTRHTLPGDIERTSMRIIESELAARHISLPPEASAVIRRVIHTTADFDYAENLRCITEDPLTEEEMNRIAALEKGNRLVKGQVFLWPGARDWHDLWDEDGSIPG